MLQCSDAIKLRDYCALLFNFRRCTISFQEYPVSDFGRSVIASLAEEPLFRMSELNPRLSRRVAKLRKAVEARREAALAFPYVLTCRAGEEVINR